MERFGSCVLLISVLLVLNIEKSYQHAWVTTDECKLFVINYKLTLTP